MKRSYPIIVALFLLACAKEKPQGVWGSGTMEATEVLVSAKTAGTVISRPIKEGDLVGEAQVIAQIDTEKIVLQKAQLLAGLDELRLNMINARRGVELANDNMENINKKFGRTQSLLRDSSATQQQFDDIETAAKAARTQMENARTWVETLGAKRAQLLAQLGLMESQLQDCRISAPLAGTVLETFIEAGELARPGGPLLKIADLRRMWVKIYLTEVEIGRIKLGNNAQAVIASHPDKKFVGRVTWISPKAEFTPKNVQTKEARADLVYAVKISIDNPEGVFKIGMPVDVQVTE